MSNNKYNKAKVYESNESNESNEITTEEVTEETTESKAFGIVTDCANLNIRKSPDQKGEVVGIVQEHTEMMLDLDESTDDWYKVCTTSGVEGYCMRRFITIK